MVLVIVVVCPGRQGPTIGRIVRVAEFEEFARINRKRGLIENRAKGAGGYALVPRDITPLKGEIAIADLAESGPKPVAILMRCDAIVCFGRFVLLVEKVGGSLARISRSRKQIFDPICQLLPDGKPFGVRLETAIAR